MESAALETRRAFGLLFICVSIAVAAGAVISELAYRNGVPLFYYAIIWLGSFGTVFVAAAPRLRRVAPSIKGRMKTSIKWPRPVKILNGLCWAGPFAAIAAFPSFYQYLILLGIGLGNLSTYLLVRQYSGNDNREQLIVAVISLVAIPVAIAIDTTLFASAQDIAVMLSRILIAASYGAGGVFALMGKAGPAVSGSS